MLSKSHLYIFQIEHGFNMVSFTISIFNQIFSPNLFIKRVKEKNNLLLGLIKAQFLTPISIVLVLPTHTINS